MNNRLANLVSIVFHPLLLATYLFSAFILVDPMMLLHPGYRLKAQWLVVLLVWLTTFVVPALSLVMLKFTGNISSLKLEKRKERFIPFFYTGLIYAFTAYYFAHQLKASNLAFGILVLITILILAAAIITFFWKISVHSIGVGGVVGLLLVISYMMQLGPVNYLLVAAILISGLVISARLKLQVHTPSQVYVGYLLGLLVSFMIIYWL